MKKYHITVSLDLGDFEFDIESNNVTADVLDIVRNGFVHPTDDGVCAYPSHRINFVKAEEVK